ncbi:MAG: hypothetical protein QM730_04045 [Anaerolineales bacterium]
MKYFSQDHQYINAECQNCGRVFKVPHNKCVAAIGGLSITPAVQCKCGTTFDLIEGASLDYWKITGGIRVENDHHLFELIELLDRLLPLTQWDFRMSAHYIYYSNKWDSVLSAENYHGLGYPIVFYDSEKCRLRVDYSWSSREYERTINIKYGRLEVPDTANSLLTSTNPGNYHLYWHSVRVPLYFLDGLSPQEARNAKDPGLIKEFEQSAIVQGIKSEPEKDTLLHATIWETYALRLFDIFDARHKDLWEQYSTFVHDYWKALPRV